MMTGGTPMTMETSKFVNCLKGGSNISLKYPQVSDVDLNSVGFVWIKDQGKTYKNISTYGGCPFRHDGLPPVIIHV